MIVGSGVAAGAVAAGGVGVLAWGAAVSARSAVRGPVWAQAFLSSSRKIWYVTAAALLGLVVIEPRWMGPALSYLALAAGWMAGRVAEGLDEALQMGPYEAPSRHRQLVILSRTVLGLTVAAAVALASGVIVGQSSTPGLVLALMVGAILGVLAWRLWSDGTRRLLVAAHDCPDG